MTRTALFSLSLALLLGACGEDDGGGGPPGPADDTGGADGGATGDGGGGDGGGPSTEQDCTDGVDEDGDGAADCLDSDCADAWQCKLPERLDFHSVFDFRGNTIECEVWGIEVDVDIDDCRTDTSAVLALVKGGPQACPQCDRTYRGNLVYAEDSCSDLLETAPPVDAAYGYIFVDEFNRELWAPDDTGAWIYLETLSSDNGRRWELGGSEAIWADPDDCDNGDQNLGTLTVTLSWLDQ